MKRECMSKHVGKDAMTGKKTMTKKEMMYAMIDRVGETRGRWLGKPAFIAEDVDVLEITCPNELYLQFEDKGMTFDLRTDRLNNATKDQLCILLSSISPTRTRAYVEDTDEEIGKDEE
jgi:hypothetical protein